jgi:hypothetical protein
MRPFFGKAGFSENLGGVVTAWPGANGGFLPSFLAAGGTAK